MVAQPCARVETAEKIGPQLGSIAQHVNEAWCQWGAPCEIVLGSSFEVTLSIV